MLYGNVTSKLFLFFRVNHFSRIMTNDSVYIKYEISTLAGFCLTIGYSSCVMLWKPSGAMVSSPDQFRYSSLDTHSQNRTFRASLLTANKFARNFVLFMNGRPLRPADLSNFYASMKFVQIWHDAWTVTQTPQAPFMFFLNYTLLWKTCSKCPAREIHSPSGFAAILAYPWTVTSNC